MQGIDTIRDVYRAAEMVANSNIDTKAVAVFKEQYLCELREQLTSPFTAEEELNRTLWLDMIRWMLMFRFAYVQVAQFTFKGRIGELAPVLVTMKYNPYCNYTIRFGENSCKKCPLVVYDVVRWGSEEAIVPDDDYLMRCILRNPRVKLMRYNLRRGLFREFFALVKNEVWDGAAVDIWKKVHPERRGALL